MAFVRLSDALALGGLGSNHRGAELTDLIGERIDLVESLVEFHGVT